MEQENNDLFPLFHETWFMVLSLIDIFDPSHRCQIELHLASSVRLLPLIKGYVYNQHSSAEPTIIGLIL